MSKKNNKTLEVLLDAFRDGATYVKAAEMAGINRVTLFKWRVNDPELDQKIEAAKVSRVKMVEDALFVSAMKGNIAAQIFYLKNRAGWRDKQDVEHSGSVTLDVTEILNNVNDHRRSSQVSGGMASISDN